MKHIFIKTPSILALLLLSLSTYSQYAFQNLSNLSATSVNTSLTPASTNVSSLGTSTRSWRNIFISNAYYLEGLPVLRAPGTTNFFGGLDAGNFTVTGSYNTAYGQNALKAITSGSANTGIGYNALTLNTTGHYNTGVGAYSLDANTSGLYNTGVGYHVLSANTTGSYNTALGVRGLALNTTGINNTAAGYYALYSNSTGSSNTALGSFALYVNSTGYENTATGRTALRSNTTGSGITANGFEALYSNTTGGSNDAFGHKSLYANTTASFNVAFGSLTLTANTTGNYNTAGGRRALQANTTGRYNTALGYNAGTQNTIGSYNTYIGYSSGNNNGSFNTAIGYNAGATVANLTNTTAVGYGAVPTASNQVRIGNTAVLSVRAAGPYIVDSDGRFKKDFNENVPGLEFINLLKPMTYHYDVRGLEKKSKGTSMRQNTGSSDDGGDDGEAQRRQLENAAIEVKERKLYTGFVAQQVEEVAKKLNYDFSGIHVPQNENDIYGISYSDFVIPLVKAVQQLSGAKDSLEQLVLNLEERFSKLESAVRNNPSSSLTLSDASIAQNSPNPFKGNTVISYNLPQQGLSNAQIVVYDAAGKSIKSFNLSGQGKGTINVNANLLPAGTYQYSLIVNGKIIETKKMLLTK